MKIKEQVFPAQTGTLGKTAKTTACNTILKQPQGQRLQLWGTVFFIGWFACITLLYAVMSLAFIAGWHPW
ncbi:MAG: hypothetical protein Q8R88_00155 [Desulfoprunum sp.]|nr:hypothetical protein [Desulfoprunum sp.]